MKEKEPKSIITRLLVREIRILNYAIIGNSLWDIDF